MIETVAQVCLIALGLSMLPAIYRIVQGPSVADRVIATDALVTAIMAIVILVSLTRNTREYMEAVMAMAILGFFGTVALAKYLVKGRAID